MENQQKYEAFRRAYPAFYYHGFSVSCTGAEIHVRYDFEIENLCAFHPTLRINAAVLPIKNAPDTPAARRILFGLGMVELISYWKCACRRGWLSNAAAWTARIGISGKSFISMGSANSFTAMGSKPIQIPS